MAAPFVLIEREGFFRIQSADGEVFTDLRLRRHAERTLAYLNRRTELRAFTLRATNRQQVATGRN